MNTITISGKVYRPEVTYTQSGMAIFTGGLSVYCGKKNDEAQYGFINVKAFKDQAENLGNSIKEKDDVIVTGRLNIESWEKDGVKHTKFEIIVDAMGVNSSRQKKEIVIPGQEESPMDGFGKQKFPEEEIPF